MIYLITGGLGFIGSNFIEYMMDKNPDDTFINVDMCSYASSEKNISENIKLNQKYSFIKADISNKNVIENIFFQHKPDIVVHFAAESHVDKSIVNPYNFINSNIIGTYNLLEASREIYKDNKNFKFHHISTDEVFGTLGYEGSFTEKTAYDPSSPYSASKAASDHLVRAWNRTYKLPVTLSNCSNNYGPKQHKEKLIPLMITNALEGKELPVYGDGKNIRDWLYVEDHCSAIEKIIKFGKVGETYNIGGNNEKNNLYVVNKICELVALETNKKFEDLKKLIKFVNDRPGHDFRYSIDFSKIKSELGWEPTYNFDTGLKNTIAWYIKNYHV